MFTDFDELVGVATEAALGSDGHCLWCDLPLAPGEVRVLRSFKPATSTWPGQQRWLALQPTAAERGSADEEGEADGGDGGRVVIVEGYHPQCAFQYAGAVHATCRACGRESRGFGGDRVVTRMANRVSKAAPAVAPAAAAAAASAGGGEADDGGGHARCSEARLRSSGALSGRLYHCFACVARFVGEHHALLRGQLSPAQAQCDVAWRPRYWRNAFHRGEGKSECGKVLLPGGDTRADFLRCFGDGDVGGDTRGARGARGGGGGGSGSACTARQEPPPPAGAASAASAEEGGGQAPAPAVAVHTQLQAKIAAAMRQDAGVVEHERAEVPTCSPTKKQRLGALLSVDAQTANEQVAGGEYYQARLLRQEWHLKSKGRAAAHEGGSGNGDCSGGGAAAAAPAVPVAASTPGSAKSVTFKLSNDDDDDDR